MSFRDFSLTPPEHLFLPRTNADNLEEFTGERFIPGYADGSVELEHIHRYLFALQFITGSRVLDIACGEGYGSSMLSTLADHVTGVDIDAQCIDRAKARYSSEKVHFSAGSATQMPVGDAQFDVVVSFETIEHLEDQEAFWSEIRRVLKPDGLLILSSPNRGPYRKGESPNIFHVKELTRDELIAATADRFKYYHIYNQHVAFGSQILPDGESNGYWNAVLDRETAEIDVRAEASIAFPYAIVVASDREIQAASPSLYQGHYPAGAMAALIGGIKERDGVIRELREAIENNNDLARLGTQNAENSPGGPSKTATTNLPHERASSEQLREIIAEKELVISAMRDLIRSLGG